MVIDLHSHSKKKSAFFYGCNAGMSEELDNKEFPFLFGRVLGSKFVFEKSKWTDMRKAKKDKEGTARFCLWKRLKT